MKFHTDYDSHEKIITVDWSTSITHLIQSIKLIDLIAQLNQPYIKIIVDRSLRLKKKSFNNISSIIPMYQDGPSVEIPLTH